MSISLTYTFSTEEELREFLGRDNTHPAHVEAEASKPKASKPKASKPKAEPKPEPEPEPEAEAEAEPEKAEEAKPKAEPGEDTGYKDIQRRVFRLAQTDREAALEVAESLGIDSFKKLDPSQYTEAAAALDAKIAELGA